MRRVRVLGLLVVLLALAGLTLRLVFLGSGAQGDGALRLQESESASESSESTSLPTAMQAGAATDALERTAVEAEEDFETPTAKLRPTAFGPLLVVEADGETPRPNFKLRTIVCWTTEVDAVPDRIVVGFALLETDADGRAELGADMVNAPSVQYVRFVPTEDASVRCDPMELPMERLSKDPNAPTVLRLIARKREAVRGRAVDAITNEPVPQLALRVERWLDLSDTEVDVDTYSSNGFLFATSQIEARDAEWVITDSDGRFITQRAYPKGRIGFLTIDEDRAELIHDPAANSSEVQLKVPVGPVVLLNFQPTGGRTAEDYVAAMDESPEQLVATWGIVEYPSPWAADGGTRSILWGNASPVQGGVASYVRLTMDQTSVRLPSFLCLISRDGASFGFAEIRSLESHRQIPLQVDVYERLGLQGVLVWPDGADDDLSAVVYLRDLAQPNEEGRRYSIERVRDEGESSFQFQALAPGRYRLSLVATEELEGLTLDVELPWNANLVLRPRLTPPEDLHEFSIRILTDSKSPLDGEEGRAYLDSLFLIRSDEYYRKGAVVWEGGEGHVVIPDLKSGEYSVVYHVEVDGTYRDELAQQTLHVPGPELLLRVRDL